MVQTVRADWSAESLASFCWAGWIGWGVTPLYEMELALFAWLTNDTGSVLFCWRWRWESMELRNDKEIGKDDASMYGI